jgi:hypothetical protein
LGRKSPNEAQVGENVKMSVAFRSALLAIALTFGSLVGAAPASADTGCADGNVCFWPLQNFEGNKQSYGNNVAGQWFYVNGGQNYHSLKNRFTNRAVLTGKVNVGNLVCTPAGNSRATAPEFDAFFVGAPGSHC